MTIDAHPLLHDTINLLGKLVAFPTVSGDSNLAMIDYCAEYLRACGGEVDLWKSEDGKRANCLARFGDDGSMANGIVLSGHSDVVPVTGQNWTHDPFTLTKKDGKLFGRGSCDMKGFIAASMVMAKEYSALKLTRPLAIALTFDEETGCLGGQQMMRDLAKSGLKPSVCIIGEPTEMRVIEGHKGCYEYTTHFEGLAIHGSLTHQGVNAVEYAALYITKLMEIREELKNVSPQGARFDPPYTTLQVGHISGGVSRNTVAGNCSVEWEMRPVKTDDADHVKQSIAKYVAEDLLPAMKDKYPAANITLETIGEVFGLEPTTQSEARDICIALTGNSQTDVVSFGTEAGLYQEYGVSCVVCGPGSIEQAHKPDEYITKSELARCLHMLDGLKEKLTNTD